MTHSQNHQQSKDGRRRISYIMAILFLCHGVILSGIGAAGILASIIFDSDLMVNIDFVIPFISSSSADHNNNNYSTPDHYSMGLLPGSLIVGLGITSIASGWLIIFYGDGGRSRQEVGDGRRVNNNTTINYKRYRYLIIAVPILSVAACLYLILGFRGWISLIYMIPVVTTAAILSGLIIISKHFKNNDNN